jgi:nucleotide-binding universal stress UspA family protein
MIEIRNILCPIDFSEHSRRALDHALVIARWYGSAVTVLHVYMRTPPALIPHGGPVLDTVNLTETDREQLAAAVADFAAESNAPGLPLEIVIREGRAAAGILERAGQADLLVMGTHGRSGFDRLALGSVTEKVLRKALCPVLTVPRRVPEAVPVAQVVFTRILCPVDFSESSLRALDYAMSLAREADAHLTVLHVMMYDMAVEAPDLYETLIADRDLGADAFQQRCEAYSRNRLDTIVPDTVREACRVETRLGHGKAYRDILRVAAEQQADLIVMGVKGHGALDRMFFGSTTQHVVRQADCPVLTLRAG